MTNNEIELTTDQQGRFTGQISGLSVGTHTITIEYEGDANYTASTATRTVNVVNHDYGIDITSTTPIIQTGDIATIVATLTDNGVAVSGESLSYQIKHGSTVIDSGSSTTDSNGQVEIDYTGTGVGDVDVIVSFGMSLQETYEIEDCWKYGITNNDTVHNITSPNTYSISNGELTGYNIMLDCDWDISTDWLLECDYKKDNYRCGLFIADKTMTSSANKSRYFYLWNNGTDNVYKSILEAKDSSEQLLINSQVNKTISYSQYHHIKIVKQNNTLKVYVDDELLHSESYVDVGINTANVGLVTWQQITGYLKNLKVKAL